MVTQTFTFADKGFYTEAGNHSPENIAHAAGRFDGVELRNFFAFDLTGAFEVVSASFRVHAGFFESDDATELYRLFDVSTDVGSLVAGGTGLTATYDDLGSGASFGEITLSAADETDLVTITFNANGIAALNAAQGGLFAIGGAVVSIGSAPEQAVFSSAGSFDLLLQLETTGAADLASDPGTLGVVDVGGTVDGRIGTFGDADWFAVAFQRGDTYQINLTGSGETGALSDTLVTLFNGSGDLIGQNDDFDGSLFSTRFFTARSTGTFFIEAAANLTEIGGYTLSVTTDLTGSSSGDGLDGGIGDDLISGLGGDDVLAGGQGRDTIIGGANNDNLRGDTGADSLVGNKGRDTLIGGLDNDTLGGGDGVDVLDGGTGQDSLVGGIGDDRLTGGNGNDRMNGGRGADVFVYSDRAEGNDVIFGFRDGIDLIDISATGLATFTVEDDAGDAFIRFGNTTIRLDGIDFGLVTIEDFIIA